MTLRLAYILVPIGIFAWIAFSLPALMVNYSYILSVMSDPMGLGWNLLPAAAQLDLNECRSFSQLYAKADSTILPDLAYTLTAVFCGLPVVNFTPNMVEIPAILD